MAKANTKTRRHAAPRRRANKRPPKKPGLFSWTNIKKGVRVGTAVNVIVQLLAPYAQAVLPHLEAKDWKGAMAALPAANKDAFAIRNLVEAFGPMAAGEIALLVASKLRKATSGRR